MPAKYTNKLSGKRILVLGGTSGIGFCVAEACAEYGSTVIVASSRQEKVNKTIDRITTSCPETRERISGRTCDLASPEVEDQIKALLEFATNDGKDKLDHVVNTAGDSLGIIKLEDATKENVQKLSTVRYIGSLLLAKWAPQYMHKTNESSITLTSGVNSSKPGPNWSILAGSGGAKEGLARGLAVDLKPIRVNCISPGAILTELFDSFGVDRRQQFVEYYKSKTLTGTIGQPEDMAEAYLYLMRDHFATGTTLHSEGGYLLV